MILQDFLLKKFGAIIEFVKKIQKFHNNVKSNPKKKKGFAQNRTLPIGLRDYTC
jgi:hypothetical protein